MTVPVAVSELLITGTATAALTVRVSEEVPVPPALEAWRVTLFVPTANGVPDISPLVVFTPSPEGRLLAPKEVGLLEAVIW